VLLRLLLAVCHQFTPWGVLHMLYVSGARSSNGFFFSNFWIQVAVLEVKLPLRSRFGNETAKNL
jgi:hypothetical protein